MTLSFKKYRCKFVFFICILSFLSCQPTVPQSSKTTNKSSSSLLDNDTNSFVNEDNSEENNSEENNSEDISEEPPKFDPIDAAAVIDLKVELESSEVMSRSKFPTITIDRYNANYVEVMRCVKSYVFRSATGDDIRNLVDNYRTIEDKKSAWVMAQREYRKCKMVSFRAVAEKLQDYAAPDGSYYYIINPCFSKEKTINNKDDCSHRLSMSDPIIDYTSQIREEAREQALQLTKAEQELQANILRARGLAKLFEIRLRACQNRIATDSMLKQFYDGMIQLGVFLGAVALLAPFGSMMAIMGGQMASMMGWGMFGTKAFDLGPIANTCLSGEDEAVAIDMTSGKATKKSKAKAAKYEELYNVYETKTELAKLTYHTEGEIELDENQSPVKEADGGLIKKASYNYQNELYKMSELQGDIMTLNREMNTLDNQEDQDDLPQDNTQDPNT